MADTVQARRITSGSVEYLTVWVDSGGTVTLSAQTVTIAVQPQRVFPDDDTTWRAAAWSGSADTARSAAILIGPGTSNIIGKGHYDIWCKVTDSPEIPEVFCGRLTVT
jgi:hypothetical protein